RSSKQKATDNPAGYNGGRRKTSPRRRRRLRHRPQPQSSSRPLTTKTGQRTPSLHDIHETPEHLPTRLLLVNYSQMDHLPMGTVGSGSSYLETFQRQPDRSLINSPGTQRQRDKSGARQTTLEDRCS